MQLLFALLLAFPILMKIADDPAAGVTQTKAESRELDCRRLSQLAAHDAYPGLVPEPPPRGAYMDTQAVVCERRIMSHGERPGRDEAVLSTLRQASAETVEKAAALGPSGEVTWLVEAFYADAAVAAKIAFAHKVELVQRGHAVSDRAPVLAPDDVAILTRLAPTQAYPLACARYWAAGSLSETDVLLAVVALDPRETQLHAGLCARGEWKWLR